MPGTEAAPSQERKTIVIAVDNSHVCKKAVDFVKDHFPQGYKYHLLHVQTKPVAPCLGNADAALLSFDMESAIDDDRVVNSKTFLKQVFGPQAASGGAEVATTMLRIIGDGSSAVGHAICQFAEQHQAAALAMMKENKSSFTRFFVGSVTRYCAVHSQVPVIIIPE